MTAMGGPGETRQTDDAPAAPDGSANDRTNDSTDDRANGSGGGEDDGSPLRSLILGLLLGAAMAALVCGLVIGRPVLWGPGAGGMGLFLLAASGVFGPKSDKPVVERRKALAMIESRRATSAGESADIPVAFDLTVAPDERPAYRVNTDETINLVDIPDYKVRGIVVVEYRVDKPWEVALVTEPDAEWSRRRAEAVLDSAPESSREKDTAQKVGLGCLMAFLGLLAGAAVIVVLFRGDLFKDDGADSGAHPAPSVSSSSDTSSTTSSTTTTVTDSITTADVSGSILTGGQLRTTANSMVTSGAPTAVHLTISDHQMTARGTTPTEWTADRLPVPLSTLPYEKMPALVREAKATLNVNGPSDWQIDVTRDARTKAVRIVVTVWDANGDGTLTADETGRVTHRDPRG
ncbi:hypothetical protein ABZ901_08150 [Actinacidiphila alni]|uniref:hypothetical protein n=1 Tax=Actinacidiphila alni TaxID=380248 RepID=UPI0033CB4B24